MGGLTGALLLDGDEMYMRQKCTAAGDDDTVTSRRISVYKHKTLPVLGYLDDVDKLDIVMVMAAYHNCIVCLVLCSVN